MNLLDTISAPGLLPSNWKLVTLRDITTKIGSGATPRGGESAYLRSREQFALIRSQNIFDHRFEESGLAFISNEQAAGLANAQVRSGDVLLNITGDGVTFARACLVPDDILPACVNQHVAIVRANQSLVAPAYLAGYLAHPSTKGYIESFNAGGSRRAITKGHIESFQLPLPPLDEQKHIGGILQTIDRKIELNQRMNESLGAIARAFYKSWFVDFDPVKANIEGHISFGMGSRLLSLFPAGFSEENGTPVPSGWRWASIYEVADVIYGAPFASEFFSSEQTGLPLIRIRDLQTHEPEIYTAEEHPKRTVIKSGDVVVGMDGEFRVHLWRGPTALLNQRVCSFRPKGRAPRFFVAESIRGPLAAFEGSKTGTTVIHLGKADIDTFKLCLPSEAVLREFGSLTEPVVDRILVNAEESRTLATLRDTLLPKLMSGQIRVGHAHKMIEAGAQQISQLMES